MKYEVEVVYDPKVIVKGAKAYWRKKYRQDIYLSPIVLVVVIFWLLYVNETDVIHGVVLTVSIIYFSLIYYLGFVNPYRSVKHWKALGLHKANMIFEESGFCVKSEVGLWKFDWIKVKSVWALNDIWIINYRSGAHSSIPVEGFSSDLKNFIKDKVRVNGGIM